MKSADAMSLQTQPKPFAALSPSALYGVPWAALMFGIGAGFIFGPRAQNWGAPLWLLSAFLVGMPHGAGDLLALKGAQRTRGLSARAEQILARLYLPLALGVGVVWWVNSSAGLLFFLLLTAWHWGSADAWLLPGARVSWTLAAWARGLLVMSAPLALRPREGRDFLDSFGALGAHINAAAILEWAPPLLIFALILQLAAWLLARRVAPAEFIETALLLLLFRATPPLLAVACYFVGVHGWRHILRVEGLLPGAPARNHALKAVWNYHRRVMPLSLLALVGLVPVALIWPQLWRAPGDWLVGYLVLISALTLPHALVVGALDVLAWSQNSRTQIESGIGDYPARLSAKPNASPVIESGE